MNWTNKAIVSCGQYKKWDEITECYNIDGCEFPPLQLPGHHVDARLGVSYNVKCPEKTPSQSIIGK